MIVDKELLAAMGSGKRLRGCARPGHVYLQWHCGDPLYAAILDMAIMSPAALLDQLRLADCTPGRDARRSSGIHGEGPGESYCHGPGGSCVGAGEVKLRHEVVQEMRVGPSEPFYRERF